jgi:release factor glutamine methyltransferase
VFGESSETSSSASQRAIVARLRDAGCVFAEDEAALIVAAAATPHDLERSVRRRVAGEPLEYVLGWADFYGLRVAVDPGVFVPRERTEALVTEARALAGPTCVVVDLCCGSGAIGLALATALPDIELHSCDIDPAAVACATRNVAAVGGRVHHGDFLDALPDDLRGRVDLLVANVPYVPTDAIGSLPREARLFEPLTALDGGADGLDFVRRLADEAPGWLAPGGHVLVETSSEEAQKAVAIFAASGLAARAVASTEFDCAVIVGRRPTHGQT